MGYDSFGNGRSVGWLEYPLSGCCCVNIYLASAVKHSALDTFLYSAFGFTFVVLLISPSFALETHSLSQLAVLKSA